MSRFVGAKYFIASMFVEQELNNVSLGRYIPFERLMSCINYVQKEFNEENKNIVLLTYKSRISTVILESSDYFKYAVDNKGTKKGIVLNRDRNIDDLRNYILCYIPEDIINILSEAIHNFYACMIEKKEENVISEEDMLVKVNKKVMSMEELVDMFKDSKPSIIINIILALTDCKIKEYSKIKEDYFKTYDNGTERDFEDNVFKGRDLTILKAINVLLRNR